MLARGRLFASLLSPLSTTTKLLPLRQVPLFCRYKSGLFLDKTMSRPTVVQHSHCSYCGTKFAEGLAFPRECTNCTRKLYLSSCVARRKRNVAGKLHFMMKRYVNPAPVAVCVLPVDDGVLVVRRGIPPGKGQLAFPGGFIGLKESWQQAAVRELYEETGVIIDPVDIEHLSTQSAPDADVLLIFGIASRRRSKDLEAFIPNNEVTERLVITKYEELAFSLHSDILKAFFEKKKGKK